MSDKKYFVLRPHALLSSYDSLQRFKDNVVVVPMAVIDEVNAMKDLTAEKSKIRKHVLKFIESLMDKGLTSDNGCKLENGGILKVVQDYTDVKVEANNIEVNNISEFQKRTLQVCVGLKKEHKRVILVTNNIGLRIKAHSIGIQAEEFKDEIFPVLEEQYKGKVHVKILESTFKEISEQLESKSSEEYFEDKSISIDVIKDYIECELLENEYVIMEYNSLTYYGQVKGEKIVLLKNHNKNPYGIAPLNDGQKLLMNALYDESPLVVVKGPAGTGKTLISMAAAIDRTYDKKEFKRILITTNVSNEKLGYLPGGLDDKLLPFLAGVKDGVTCIVQQPKSDKSKKFVSNHDNRKNKLEREQEKYDFDKKPEEETGEYFFEKKIIEVQALEMLRGRSIMNTMFIIDETQNIDPEFVKTIVTRAAQGSKFIFLGDPTQVDNSKLSERYNGLVYIAEKMKGDPDCTVVSLDDNESVRSRLARTATQIL